MKKIYEAIGKDKRDFIQIDNDLRAFDLYQGKTKYGWPFKVEEIAMVASIKELPLDSTIDTHWCLNGLYSNKNIDDIIVIEPFSEQIDNKSLANISEVDTYYTEPIKLSKKAIILMSINKYEELIKDAKTKKQLNKMNLRLYEGEKDLALQMLFHDKYYIYLEMTEQGYNISNDRIDAKGYAEYLIQKQKDLVDEMQKKGRNVTYKEKNKNIDNKNIELKEIELEKNENTQINEDEKNANYKMITGLTKKVEGDIELDNELYATTDIGKIRENQEDAVLLIKDKELPKLKMMVVADGMGGWSYGEVASNTIVNELKDWFENLSDEEKVKACKDTFTLKESLSDKILMDIQSKVKWNTLGVGGSTLVCAIVGQTNTLIANVGDSRAYITKNGKIEQVSREDTAAQENLDKGKSPSKEASRFDKDSNQLTQCIGMDRRELNYPNIEIINNKDYDMILLFSDGVTDCLSDEDIAVVCRNSDKKELTNKIVEKAIRHDSIEPEELIDYTHLNLYIPGGKDNTTAAVYIPKEEGFEIGE